MKKLFFAMLAVLAIAFTGCKVGNAKVSIYVEDKDGMPDAKCYVFYVSKAAYILDAVLPPSPEELIGAEDYSTWKYVVTDNAGTAKVDVPLSVSKANYYFVAFDEINQKWETKEVTLHRGQNETVEFYFK